MSVLEVVRDLWRHPKALLIDRWNWKSAVFSSLFRGTIFLVANLTAGWRAASGAMLAEFLFRFLTAGFYGAMTQSFCNAEPEWAGNVAATLLIPFVSHSLELVIHVLRGTPRLKASLISSVVFTILSTSFNLYAMRRGALTSVRDRLPSVRISIECLV